MRSSLYKKRDRIRPRFEPVVCHSPNQAKSNINWRARVLGVGFHASTQPTRLSGELDLGEAEAIALAVEIQADQVLIDERRVPGLLACIYHL